MSKYLYRNIEVVLCFLTLFILAASFYFQYVRDMQPCPLCIMQRLCVFGLLLCSLFAIRLGTVKRARIISTGQIFFALSGIYFSGRQLWLQSLPADSAPACMPGIDVLIKYFPWQDILHALFWGAGDCAEVSWQWLGLSMPAWTFLYFFLMLTASIGLLWRLGKTK